MIKLTKDASWSQAGRQLQSRVRTWPLMVHKALMQEAHLLRQMIVDGITEQAPGDEQALKPLTLLTLAGRRLAGFYGTKALLRHADLRNSMAVTHHGHTAFVGVLRQARGRNGHALVDLAALHELGTPAFVIAVTPRMRRFLAALMAKAGKSRRNARSSNQPYIVVQIPARPFMRPAGRKFKTGLRERYLRRLQALVKRHGSTA